MLQCAPKPEARPQKRTEQNKTQKTTPSWSGGEARAPVGVVDEVSVARSVDQCEPQRDAALLQDHRCGLDLRDWCISVLAWWSTLYNTLCRVSVSLQGNTAYWRIRSDLLRNRDMKCTGYCGPIRTNTVLYCTVEDLLYIRRIGDRRGKGQDRSALWVSSWCAEMARGTLRRTIQSGRDSSGESTCPIPTDLQWWSYKHEYNSKDDKSQKTVWVFDRMYTVYSGSSTSTSTSIAWLLFILSL